MSPAESSDLAIFLVAQDVTIYSARLPLDTIPSMVGIWAASRPESQCAANPSSAISSRVADAKSQDRNRKISAPLEWCGSGNFILVCAFLSCDATRRA